MVVETGAKPSLPMCLSPPFVSSIKVDLTLPPSGGGPVVVPEGQRSSRQPAEALRRNAG